MKKQLQRTEQTGKMTLIHFYAPWCGSCQTMDPVIEKVNIVFEDNLEVIEINIDNNQYVTSYFRVQSVPTFVLLKDGEKVWQRAGLFLQRELMRIIASYQEGAGEGFL